MKNADHIEQDIKKLNFTTGPSLDERILAAASDRLVQTQASPGRGITASAGLWRKIMKSRITKLAAVAAVVVGIGLMAYMSNIPIGVTPAYAIEQTIEANRGLRSLHIKQFKQGEDIPREFWVELNDDEQVDRVRAELPAWDTPSEGPKVFVWQYPIMCCWIKNTNQFFIINREDKISLEMMGMIEECDPRKAVERIYDLEKQGQVAIQVDQPEEQDKDIMITATWLAESETPGREVVLYVDQVTKLVMRSELIYSDGDSNENLSDVEFSDYNVSFNPDLFDLGDLADNPVVIDIAGDIGIQQGELSDEDVAVEVVRQFADATIVEDYATMKRLFVGMNTEVAKHSDIKVVRIVSIGEPEPLAYPGRGRKLFVVPCEIEIEKEGKTFTAMEYFQAGVVQGQSDRWIIETFGEVPPKEMAAPNRVLESKYGYGDKIDLLDINNAGLNDVIQVFGEPEKYIWEKKTFDKNELPERYIMVYPGKFFSVFMIKNQVVELRFEQQDDGYVFLNAIRIGSTLEEVFETLGDPDEVVEGGKIEFENGVLYKDTEGRKGFCYYQRSEKGIRMFFVNNRVTALYLTRIMTNHK